MKGRANIIITFEERQPMFIIACDSGNGNAEDEIRIETPSKSKMDMDLEFHLSRENLKKLYVVIREHLKNNMSAFFTQGDKFILNDDGKVVTEKPAAEALKGGI